MTQNITVLGSTGSIGTSTLDVIRRHPSRYRAFALCAHTQVDALFEQCREFHPPFAVMRDAALAAELAGRCRDAGLPTEVRHGVDALIELSSLPEVDAVMAAIVGAAGLAPTLAAARAGKRVMLANKEVLVMAGELFMHAVRDCGATLLPVDSEHNAIFQALPADFTRGLATVGVERILLTASGGPFRNVALAPLSQDGLGRELLSGRGDLQLELQGPAADLRGELLLQARNGAIPGLDLVGALNQAGPGAAGLLPVAAGKTPYKELKARIHLAPGLADLRRLSLKSPSLRLEATARADLAGNRLEGEGMVQIAGSAREWGRANWERWQGRHLPLVLRGSPEAPAWALNLAGQGAGQSPPVRLAAGGGWNLGGRKLWLPEWLP